MIWLPLDRSVEARLSNVLQSWKGTPYMRGQKVKGIAVDCVRFVCGVLDEMYRRPFEDFRDLPSDACMENPKGAVKVMLTVLRRYDHIKVDTLNGLKIEPGDVILVGTDEGPGHAMIAGTKHNQVWHCNGKKVVFSPLSFSGKGMDKLFAVYRPQGKDQWHYQYS